jgi:hypothetical protein
MGVLCGQYGAEAVLSSAGDLLPLTPVTVLTYPAGATATLYTDLTGTATTGNPVTTDANGNLTFFAPPAQYSLKVGGVIVATVIVDVTGASVGAVGGPAGPLTSLGLVPAAQIPVTATALAIFNVMSSPYNATGNGTTDDTTAIAAAITAATSAGGTVYLPPGTYKTSATFNVTTANVSIAGAGSANTVIQPTNNTDCIRIKMASFVPSVSVGSFTGFRIDGTNAGASACGIHFGDAMNGAFDDIDIFNFTGASAIGIHPDNVSDYTEGWSWGRMNVVNNTVGVLFDINGGGSPAGISNSFGYTRIKHLRLDTDTGQVGVILRNGALVYNGEIVISANLAAGSTFMEIQGITGSGLTEMANCLYCIQAESDGGAANGIVLSQFAVMNGSGVVDLSSGTITSSEGSPNPGSFNLSGWIQLPGAVGYTWLSGLITTTATAGSGTLPAAPAEFYVVVINGNTYKIPLYLP